MTIDTTSPWTEPPARGSATTTAGVSSTDANHSTKERTIMRHELHTEIDIHATPETVWNILTDLEHYPEWNPFIVQSRGHVAVGNELINRMQPPGGKATTFKPTVTAVDAAQTFEWLGRLGVPGVFDGRHRFELEPTPSGGTRVVHAEQFQGVLVRLLRKSLDTRTNAGFEAMNAALKTRAEAFDRERS